MSHDRAVLGGTPRAQIRPHATNTGSAATSIGASDAAHTTSAWVAAATTAAAAAAALAAGVQGGGYSLLVLRRHDVALGFWRKLQRGSLTIHQLSHFQGCLSAVPPQSRVNDTAVQPLRDASALGQLAGNVRVGRRVPGWDGVTGDCESVQGGAGAGLLHLLLSSGDTQGGRAAGPRQGVCALGAEHPGAGPAHLLHVPAAVERGYPLVPQRCLVVPCRVEGELPLFQTEVEGRLRGAGRWWQGGRRRSGDGARVGWRRVHLVQLQLRSGPEDDGVSFHQLWRWPRGLGLGQGLVLAVAVVPQVGQGDGGLVSTSSCTF